MKTIHGGKTKTDLNESGASIPVVSGFAETEDVKKVQEAGAGLYLKKPLTLEKIGISVKKALET